MAEFFDEPKFVSTVAYLGDAFTALNDLNRPPRGRGISTLVACEKWSAFKEKHFNSLL